MKPVDRRTLVHVVRIAAKMADEDPQRNPAYVEAIELMATALEEAKLSCREDGDYWLVRIPQPSRNRKKSG